MSWLDPASALFSRALRRLLVGTPWGAVFPPRAAPPGLPVDGRTAALRALRAYLLEVTFFLPNPPGPPKPFRIEHTKEQPRIHIDREDWATNLLFPSIVFVAGEQEFLPIGMVGRADEDSRDVHGPGTVLVTSYEYKERVGVEVWATTKAQQRALIAGIEAALFPTEERGEILLRMPDHYGQTVRFSPVSRVLDATDDSDRRRRKYALTLEMTFNLTRLVRYREIVPSATATVQPGDSDDPVAAEPGFVELG